MKSFRCSCIHSAVFVIIALSGSVARTCAEDWPVFGHDRRHTYFSNDGPTHVPLYKKWEYRTGGSVQSSPCVANGILYVGSGDTRVYALNAFTGAKIWEFKTGGQIYSSPCVYEGMVFVGSDDHRVYALRADTGEKIWEFETQDNVRASPCIHNGTVFIGSWDKRFYALDAATGQKKWEFATRGIIRRVSTCHSEYNVYAGSTDGRLYALDAQTGEKKWELVTGGQLYWSSPCIAEGMVFVGSLDRKVYAVDDGTGRKVWEFMTDGEVGCSPCVYEGVVYVGCNSGRYYALNAATGTKIWDFRADGEIGYASCISNGYIYFGTSNRKLYAVDLATGAVKWSTTLGGAVRTSAPCVSNGMLFIGAGDGKVMAFSTIVNQADLQIKKTTDPETSYAINDVYQIQPSGAQVKTGSAAAGTGLGYDIRVENDGPVAAAYVLKATESSETGWVVTYRHGSTDISGQMKSSEGYQTPTLSPGASTYILVEMTPIVGMARGAKSTIVKVFNDAYDATPVDAVKAQTSVIPDASATLVIIPSPGYVGQTLTARITVTRTAYTNAFRVDFWRHLSKPPTARQTGTNSVEIEAGAGSVTKEIRFVPSSSGSFTAYAFVDTDSRMSETEEENNVASASYTVRSLSLGGTVRDDGGRPLAGVTVSATSASSTSTVKSAVTNASGAYTIAGLAPALYVVAPSDGLRTFNPPSRAVTLTPAVPNVTGVDFGVKGLDISVSFTIMPPSSLLGTALTAKISVSRSAATGSFWVDFYTHRATAPGSGARGNYYFSVPAGSGAFTKTITFKPSTPGTFMAWVQVDTDGFVNEVNETNNVVGPVSYLVTPIGSATLGIPSAGTSSICVSKSEGST